MLIGEVWSQAGQRNVCRSGWFNSTAFIASISRSQTSISSTFQAINSKATFLSRHLETLEEVKESSELVGEDLERNQLKFSDSFRQWFSSVKRTMMVPVLPAKNKFFTLYYEIVYLTLHSLRRRVSSILHWPTVSLKSSMCKSFTSKRCRVERCKHEAEKKSTTVWSIGRDL